MTYSERIIKAKYNFFYFKEIKIDYSHCYVAINILVSNKTTYNGLPNN